MTTLQSTTASGLMTNLAKALNFAVNDPWGHAELLTNQRRGNSRKLLRSFEEARRLATVFDSSAIPPITIDMYLLRLNATFRCSESVFIAAAIICDRLLEYDGGRLPLTEKNVHRAFFASLVVSAKFFEDLVYTNKHYAKAGGVQLSEVNRLERMILSSLDFDMTVCPAQFERYEAILGSPSSGYEEVAHGRAGDRAQPQPPWRQHDAFAARGVEPPRLLRPTGPTRHHQHNRGASTCADAAPSAKAWRRPRGRGHGSGRPQ